ncbi:MAG: Nif11-like leader peptide family RiPP precursor [Peptococcaceae bacterium]|nr:Nif11-like leader peptide family RiPP precursor [Peptococcaceae bacterium]
MSIESLNKFLQMLAENEEAANKVKEIGLENAEEIIAYARKLGYDFNRQEFDELRNRVIDINKARIKKNLEKAAAQVKEQRTGMQNLNRFVKLVEENKDIANKVQEIGFDDPKAIIAYAGELGFEFDEQDLEEFGSQILEQSDELTEEELEQVAGGGVLALVVLGLYAAGAAAVGVGVGTAVGAAMAGVAVGVTSLVK